MNEQSFFEPEALEATVVAASRRLRARVNVKALLANLSPENADRLNDLVVALYRELRSPLVAQSEEEPPAGITGYGSLIHAEIKDGRPARMTFFRVKEAWVTIAINLVALKIALLLLSPTAVIPAFNTVRAMYENLIVLDGEENEISMRSYEALSRWEAENRETKPTFAELLPFIATGTGSPLSTAQLLTALRYMSDKKLVCIEWGGEAGDFENAGNRWATAL